MGAGTFYPAASGDDGYWYPPSNFSSTAIFAYMGSAGTNLPTKAWIRFLNVTIPQNATITNAYVQLTASHYRTATTVNVDIFFNNVDDASSPGSYSAAEALTLTTAVSWDNIGSWEGLGTQHNTPDISSILQTIINKSGWSSNNSLQVVIKDDGSTDSATRMFCTIDHSSGIYKAELHVTWTDPPPEVAFTFSNPIPAHLSTVYGITEQLCLTTTVSGDEPSYTYDAMFYTSSGIQIGTTVSGINSGSQAYSNVDLPTPSGIDYSWYVTATSSGSEDTSSTYTFSNRFLYEGYVTENDNPVARTVRLYYRDTGELVATTTSSGIDGYYKFGALINDQHFIVAFDDVVGEDYNALILDKLLPNGTE